ncbi:arylamine N-acetyltransferase (macronuclear) [Tetrahymena thermophila SB210]|uniref:Arylamine N-acetyltransferase n=1 Tax=Tetrahymena thermophila (strain SB210) TaxID=312017 RepID=Q245B6_TETTS|nr:arylamine N-acetyltransferase [Tetrahymena thermophila SB210]EAS03321.2 arylamine N-acetyltransferase [Tetrahymena thermophila SB210]|eukprot:XP_001023566.2 arylamine N-acetyltransferase [Tetrahymena thermophila SB210]
MQSSTPFLLSEQETQQFLNLLQLEKLKEGECKLKYLEALVQKTQEVIPFQNLFLLQHKFEQRNQLSFQEIKKLVLTGTGGYCLVISPVFCGLLQSLGYQASLICGSCRGIPKNHAAILVNNLLENEDKYLVEVSIGFKNKPLKIDFDKKSELYNYSFGQFYFEWQNDQKQILNRIDEKNQFFCQYSLNITFKDYEDLLFNEGNVYTDVNKSPFHKFLRIIRFPSSGAVCIRDNQLLIENLSTNKLEIKDTINSIDQFNRHIQELFPQIDKQMSTLAYKNFQLSQNLVQN